MRLFDIVIAPSIAQCCSGDPVGPSKFTGDAKAPDGQPPRGLLFIMRPQRQKHHELSILATIKYAVENTQGGNQT